MSKKKRVVLSCSIGSIVAIVALVVINELRISRAIAYVEAAGGAPSVETNWLGEPLEVHFGDWSSLPLNVTSIEGISSRLPRLSVLIIAHQSIDDAAITAISRFCQLEYLYLQYCDINATTLAPLQQIETLRGVGFGHSVVTESFVDSIAQLFNIQGVDLRCTGVTDEQIEDLRRQLGGRVRIDYQCPSS